MASTCTPSAFNSGLTHVLIQVFTQICRARPGCSPLEGTGITFQYLAFMIFSLSAVIMCLFASQLIKHGASAAGTTAPQHEVDIRMPDLTDQPQRQYQEREPALPQSSMTFAHGPFGRLDGV